MAGSYVLRVRRYSQFTPGNGRDTWLPQGCRKRTWPKATLGFVAAPSPSKPSSTSTATAAEPGRRRKGPSTDQAPAAPSIGRLAPQDQDFRQVFESLRRETVKRGV